MKVYLKIHKNESSEVIAACDDNILGIILRKENLIIKISEQFYGGNLIEIEDAITTLRNTNNFNIVGKNIIKACIDNNIITEDGCIEIDGIPMAIKFIF